MSNLRIVRSRVTSNTSFRVQFTSSLNTLINTSNIIIEPVLNSLPTPKVKKVKINKSLLDITTDPLTPFAYYNVYFVSSQTTKFSSIDGTEFIIEDDNSNAILVQALNEPNSVIKEALLQYNADNVYNFDGENVVSHIVDAQDKFLSKALHDIGQAANDNYLEILISDEFKTRGSGAYDRLNQEGAFEVVRVGLEKTGYKNSLILNYPQMPKSVISLLRSDSYDEICVPGSGPGTFDGLTIKVKKSPIIKLTKLTINYISSAPYVYDISKYGYQIKNNIYDQEFASSYLLLDDNEIKLSDKILEDGINPPTAADTITLSYEYKSLGRVVDPESVVVYEISKSVREVSPPITTEFSTINSPIIMSSGKEPTLGGIAFLNPVDCSPFSETHPAFKNEIPFRIDGLPSYPGQYSVDYSSGRVFVYGEKQGSGTGFFPPAMTYFYKKTYINNLDYTFNPETGDIAASPLRNLIGNNVYIEFKYQQNLVPNIDYIANVHVEKLNERVENRLASLNSIYTLKSPITNVFRLINETSGEIYPVTRYSDTSIFFSYSNPPRIDTTVRERVSFTNVSNETLLVQDKFINTNTVDVFKVQLVNDNIMNSSDDALGSSFNSSIEFSRKDIFNKELYFDDYQLTSVNYNKLQIGQFVINYKTGTIFVGVDPAQTNDIGTINYKKSTINTSNKHIISVSGIYNNINPNSQIKINYNYSDFTDNEIQPTYFNVSNERFLNNDTSLPFIYDNGNIKVTNDISVIRGIYDVYDLNNNADPINFVGKSTFQSNVISVDQSGVNFINQFTVNPGLQITVPFISSGIEIGSVKSVIRISDGAELWNSSGTVSGYTITLPGINSPLSGDAVVVSYNLVLNGASSPVVDYDRGGYFVDYSYLADELVVYYEYGDNLIDFRESSAINSGDQYYVTYKVGALRDSLYQNFGSLIDIPIISSFDTSYERERYRDALQGALQSFLKGPTLLSMRELVKSITKINPEIIESIFDVWSLGISSLYPNGITVTGEPVLTLGKYDNGLLVEKEGQSAQLPLLSNLRLEEGTLNLWFIPNWNGLDNDSTLEFYDLTRDGYSLLETDIFIGSDSHHPVFENGKFKVSRFDSASPEGLPSEVFSNNGLFIYFDKNTNKWKILAKDNIGEIHKYKGKISTSGEFYDISFIQGLGEPNDILRSITNRIEFTWNLDGYDTAVPDGYSLDGYVPGSSFDGISFMSDDKHYLFDFAESESKNRFSIFKDGSGYLNFEIFDNASTGSKQYKVSSNISDWKAGEKHFISTSWKLNTYERRDEMHLFIDGVEVPNIMKFGGRPEVTVGDKWRIVKPEYTIGTISKNIIKRKTLTTTLGSSTVYDPTFDFSLAGIIPGDTINILENNFGLYIITSVSGNYLTLNSPVPSTLVDVRYSLNQYSSVVSNEVDLSANIAVYLLRAGNEIEIPGERSDDPSYIVSKNGLLQTVITIIGPAQVGDQVLIRTLGLNHRRCREKVYLWDSKSLLKTKLPPPINLNEVSVTSVILPIVSIGPNNSVISGPNFVSTGIIPTQVSNTSEGRTLSIRITGDNTNFSTPVQVKITGTSSGPTTETLIFSSPTAQNTVNKWKTISDVEVTVTPYSFTANSTAIEIKEAYPITNSEGNNLFPIIRYSFQNNSGTTLTSDGYGVLSNGYFTDRDVGNSLVITSPVPAVGTYLIESLTDDGYVTVNPVPPAFINGSYSVYNTTIGRSGFQNGFFTFQIAGQVNQPYNLPSGTYIFDYASYLQITFDNIKDQLINIGSNFQQKYPARGIIDELTIFSRKLTDIRVGESLPSTEKSVTTLYSKLRQFEPDKDTLTYISFNEFPLKNEADFYKIATREYLQSSDSVNSEFGQSIVVNERPYIIQNNGNLSTVSEGTIEFWVSPMFETYNDPVVRYYFDASSYIIEEVTSISADTVKISGSAGSIQSITLITDSKVNYFEGGHLLGDKQTIKLGKQLPSPLTKVKVSYVPVGYSGDRISIFKDKYGTLIFNVRASGIDYQVSQPIFWQRNSWHKIKALFKFNRVDNKDEIRLFVDGREGGVIRYGQNLLYGQGAVYGQGMFNELAKLITDINFKDILNEIYIGSAYNKTNIASARFDNLKISNTYKKPLLCSGVYIDESYQTNIDQVYPSIEDLYTTLLLNFDSLVIENKDFAIVRDELSGIFNFILNVIDSFKIVSSSDKTKQILEALVRALKPASSKVQINYYN